MTRRCLPDDPGGHGRSTQNGDGHDMDHDADDLAAVTLKTRVPHGMPTTQAGTINADLPAFLRS